MDHCTTPSPGAAGTPDAVERPASRIGGAASGAGPSTAAAGTPTQNDPVVVVGPEGGVVKALLPPGCHSTVPPFFLMHFHST